MNTKTSWRLLSLVVVVTMLLGLMPGFISAEEPAAPPAKPLQAPPPPTKPSVPSSMDRYLVKLHPDLRDLAMKAGAALPKEVGKVAKGAPDDPILIYVIASVDEKEGQKDDLADRLKPYFVDGKVRARPALGKAGFKIQILIGEVRPQSLLKIASLGSVQRILPVVLEKNAAPDIHPDDDVTLAKQPGPEDWAKLRENADKLREGSLPWDQAKAYGDGRERPPTEDWFEVSPEGPHKAEAAWGRGYDGTGVTVAVLDDGIDFGHPDLMGTQKIYSSTVNSEYNGWPMAFSPFSMDRYAAHPAWASIGQPGMSYADTTVTPTLSACGSGISCFEYTPIIDFATPGFTHGYVISDSMSLSGVVHVGTHPDYTLRDYVWGERVAILACDPNTAGVYDTVYVDLDDDYDFRDEKPCTKADVTDLANTRNNPISYRDMSVPPDGIADLSGGAVIFIADGVNPIPVSDWMWGGLTPTNGDLVCFTGGQFGSGPFDSHGTLCGSAVAAQGVVNGLVPDFRDLPLKSKGQPAAAIYGGAPGAKLVDVSDIYYNYPFSTYDAYFFVAVGYDGVDQTGFDMYTLTGGHTDTDAIQANSNSYGASDTDNDGWEWAGQFISQIQRHWAPYEQYLFSTGNGAPGYGTVAPPSPATAIGIGASTQYGSTGWDTITDTNQIMFNDIAAWSNRGPSARQGAGVDVVAGGARAAGAVNLNFNPGDWGVIDGNLCWETWGGTSRSAPIALGNIALLYQAYKDNHGTWPTYDVARALFMGSSNDIDYNVLVQGAGSVNADRATLVAAGDYGVYVTDPSWEPGDYRGTDWPGFAHVVYPGDVWNKTFTVHNDSAAAITVDIDDGTPQLIGSETFTFTVTEDMFNAKNPDNFFKAFQFYIPITAAAGMDASWYNVDIPADTELMIVRMRYPYSQYDADGDYNWDNRFRMAVYNWKDVNGNNVVWTDSDGNGVVNFVSTTNRNQIDMDAGDGDVDWDNPATEVDRWEYGRFDYNRPGGNILEQWVRDPLGRMHDGLFIGLQQYDASTVEHTDMTFRIDFYKYQDVPWLTTDVPNLVVPAGGTQTFQGTVTVPGDMPPGDYEAAIKVYDPGDMTHDAHTTVIPVVINVAADFAPGLTLGGEASYTYDQGLPYNNGLVRGGFDWTWRAESGDWRFFYMDVDNCTLQTAYTEDFEADNGGYTAGGTNSSWAWGAPTSGPGAAHSGTNVWATNLAGNYNADEDSYIEREIDLSAYAGSYSIILDWWEYADVEYGYDSWYADVSNDGGGSWTRLQWWTGYTGGYWHPQYTLDPSYAVSNFRVRFGVIADFSIQEPGLYVDDITIQAQVCNYPPDSEILIRDEWDDAAPYTDIDTVILGPTPSIMGSGWYWDASEPSYYGPYVLDTIASSPNTYIGSGTWRFDTSSGGNEDWVTLDIGTGGLHEILQHNVLFEGDKFDVVFTKTLGMLYEDPHSFAITTNTDQGTVGTLTVSSTMDLNGLVVDSYLSDLDVQTWVNEPIIFVDSNTNEWVYDFQVQDGLSIELTTSSPDISDIDLYLYYSSDGGATWDPVGASTGADANEYILILGPEDGDWRVAINNWSGPAGHFNLTKAVSSRAPGLTITGVPTGPVPANTDVVLTINYDKEMQGGATYPGMVVLGPPEAPQLKEVPVAITRMGSSFLTSYKDAPDTVPAGGTIVYNVYVINSGTELANVTLTDPIPANTTYASHVSPPPSHFEYNSTADQMEWSGHVVPGDTIQFTFAVDVALGTRGETITNTATIVWNGKTMDLTDSTLVEAAYHIYLPIVIKELTYIP